jgi:uncharacterized protein (DUF1778 family)
MTLELSPELETQIERAARQHGTDAQSFAIEVLRVAAQTVPEEKAKPTKEERRAILERLSGSLKNSTTTVDDFLAERSEEGRREANK